MAQNVYDDPDFFEAYAQYPRSKQGLTGAAEWPTVQGLLPNLEGLRVIDLGCGYGWFCRYARERGASEVTGFDLSERMLARAQSLTQDGAIRYLRADLDELTLAPGSADLVYSSLAFHYLPDLGRLLSTIYDALVPGGRLVFTTEHPLFMAPLNPEFMEDANGQRIWPLNHYSVEGKRTTNWLKEGVVKYHRTLATTLNLLIERGFFLERIEEWKPTEAQLLTHPEWNAELDRPTFLIVSASKAYEVPAAVGLS